MNYWSGRIDGIEEQQKRWHQIVKKPSAEQHFQKEFVLVGFCSDLGVARNLGRAGARTGPDSMRTAMSNFPANRLKVIWDQGDIFPETDELEMAQKQLQETIENIYERGGKSLVLGGGHEIMYPHFRALKNHFTNQKIGIINFDAHFDNRPLKKEIGATSGTGFYQIAQETEIHSLHIGIAKNSNTQELFSLADKWGMQYILKEELRPDNLAVKIQIEDFIKDMDLLYVSICLDVFASAFAPGVSATAYNGLIPDNYFLSLFQNIIQSPKLYAFDIAELNPDLDIDQRTAKLAASFVFNLFEAY